MDKAEKAKQMKRKGISQQPNPKAVLSKMNQGMKA
jgi:hypothetical protein